MIRSAFSAMIFVASVACEAVAPVQARPATEGGPVVERVDPAHGRVWRVSRAGVEMSDPSGTTSIDLPDWQWIAPPYGCLPDIALGPGGEAVVTSNVLPTLWRIDPRSLAVTVHPLILDSDPDKDIGFSRIVYSPERGAYYGLAEQHRSVWEIPTRLTEARKVPPRVLRQRLFRGDHPCAARSAGRAMTME